MRRLFSKTSLRATGAVSSIPGLRMVSSSQQDNDNQQSNRDEKVSTMDHQECNETIGHKQKKKIPRWNKRSKNHGSTSTTTAEQDVVRVQLTTTSATDGNNQKGIEPSATTRGCAELDDVISHRLQQSLGSPSAGKVVETAWMESIEVVAGALHEALSSNAPQRKLHLRSLEAFPPSAIPDVWSVILRAMDTPLFMRAHGNKVQREATQQFRESLHNVVIALDLWTYTCIDKLTSVQALRILSHAYLLHKQSDDLNFFLSDKVLDGLAKKVVNEFKVLPSNVSKKGKSHEELNALKFLNEEALRAEVPPNVAIDAMSALGVMNIPRHFHLRELCDMLTHVAKPYLDAIAEAQQQRTSEGAMISSEESPGDREQQDASKESALEIRKPQEDIPNTTPHTLDKHHLRGLVSCYCHYRLNVGLESLSDILVATTHDLNEAECGVLVSQLIRHRDVHPEVLPIVVGKWIQLKESDRKSSDSVFELLSVETARGLIGMYKSMCRLKAHPHWEEMYNAVSMEVASNLLNMTPLQVSKLLALILHRDTHVPYHPLHQMLVSKLLHVKSLPIKAAELVFIAHAQMQIVPDESTQSTLNELFNRFGTNLNNTAFAAALSVADLSALPEDRIQRMVTHFTEISVSLPGQFFSSGLLALTSTKHLRRAMDPISFKRIIDHANDEGFRKTLTATSAAEILTAIANLQRSSRSPTGFAEVTENLRVTLLSKATRGSIQLHEMAFVVNALDGVHALSASMFTRLNTLLLANIDDETPLAALLQAFSALAEEVTKSDYSNGTAFNDCWQLIRQRVIAEAHQFHVMETVNAVVAFSKLDVYDKPLFSVLIHRLLEIAAAEDVEQQPPEQQSSKTPPPPTQKQLLESLDWLQLDAATLAVMIRMLYHFGLSDVDLMAEDNGATSFPELVGTLGVHQYAAVRLVIKMAFALNTKLDDLYPVDVVALMPDLLRLLDWASTSKQSQQDHTTDLIPVENGHYTNLPMVVDVPLLHWLYDKSRSAYLIMFDKHNSKRTSSEEPTAEEQEQEEQGKPYIPPVEVWSKKAVRSLMLNPTAHHDVVMSMAETSMADEQVLNVCMSILSEPSVLTKLSVRHHLQLIGALMALRGGPTQEMMPLLDAAWAHKHHLGEEDQQALTKMAKAVRRAFVKLPEAQRKGEHEVVTPTNAKEQNVQTIDVQQVGKPTAGLDASATPATSSDDDQLRHVSRPAFQKKLRPRNEPQTSAPDASARPDRPARPAPRKPSATENDGEEPRHVSRPAFRNKFRPRTGDKLAPPNRERTGTLRSPPRSNSTQDETPFTLDAVNTFMF